ncbi:MAG: hypothetical protein IKL65_01330 [Bacilli bacterium]|nr:hypothetical protein [Bacilli bacterium]
MGEKIKFIDASNMEIKGDSIEYSDKEYTIDDCILVRTTDIFPSDGIIQTPVNGNAYEFGDSTFLKEAILTRLRQKYPNYYLNDEDALKLSNELREFNVCFETCRSTIHFALNGLVGSTAYGNFEGKPFVIFEPLKYHLDESLKSLRVEDVYFDSDMKLSDESSILISEEYFKLISTSVQALEQLKNFKIYVYKGNQQIAVSEVLKDLGYDSFLVTSNGYANGLNDGMAASNMWRFVNSFAKENNISLDRHFYSSINYEDSIRRQEKGVEIDKLHLKYVLENSDVPNELKDKIIQLLDADISFLDPLMQVLVGKIGLDKLKELTIEFNQMYINNLNSSKKVNRF